MKPAIVAICSLVSLTTIAQLKSVESGVYSWSEIVMDAGKDKASRSILEGSSSHLDYLEIHATTQLPRARPNLAHANEDIEECIIVKEGLMKVTVTGKSVWLGPEGVILLMPKQMHSIENAGDKNLSYYVMRYRSKKKMDLARGISSGGSLLLNADSLAFKPSARGGGRAYFDRPTAMCDRFEMHVSMLDKKGPSHAPHTHEETEVLLMISGNTEMTIDGKEYKAAPGDFYLVNSMLLHGIRNATDKPCTYFAFKWR